VGQEVCSNKRLCDVGHHEAPCELSAQSQVEAKRQPSVGGDGCAVGSTEIVINAFPALWNQLAGEHAEVGAGVNAEVQLTGLVCDEKAAGGNSADVCRRRLLR
jgi:hypothetical protein